MKTTKTERLIIGATFYGLSKLMTNPQNTILIERTALVGREFVDSLNEKPTKKVYTKSNFGHEFKTALETEGFLNNEGEIYPAPSLFTFCNMLNKQPHNILFNTEITQIEKTEKGYKVTYYNTDGLSYIIANEIIDTTPTGVFNLEQNYEKWELAPFTENIKIEKSLNVVLKNPQKVHTVRNSLMGVDIYKFPLKLNDSIITARQGIYKLWHETPDFADECKILFIANTFAYQTPCIKEMVSQNYFWVPGCGFNNLLHAVDEGQVM